MKIGGALPMLMHTTYHLIDIKDGKASVDFTSSISTNSKAKELHIKGMKMSYDIKGSSKGKSEIDTASGMILKTDFTQTVKGKMKMEGSSSEFSGMEIPLDMKITSSITNKRK